MTRSRDCALVAPMLTAREGELTAEEQARVDAHLEACEACALAAADLAATDGMFAEALLAEAARRDFAPFVDEVMARVERDRSWWSAALGWARRHRAAALAGTLAPTLAAAALIVYFSSSGAVSAPLAGDVEVEAEGRVATVLQTSEGPVVLLDSPDET